VQISYRFNFLRKVLFFRFEIKRTYKRFIHNCYTLLYTILENDLCLISILKQKFILECKAKIKNIPLVHMIMPVTRRFGKKPTNAKAAQSKS
jgi:hypothetical protein